MKTLAQTLEATLNQTKSNALSPQPSEQPKPVVLHQSPESKQKMAMMLTQLFLTLKTFGKDAEQLESIIPIFNLVLADYPFDKIEQAFAFYLKTSSEMPTPSDIANIIERGNKPPFERSVYVSISKKEGEHRTREEWKYLRDYEQFMVTGKN